MWLIVLSALLQVIGGVWAFAMGTHEPVNKRHHLRWYILLASVSVTITIVAGIRNSNSERGLKDEITNYMEPQLSVESAGMDLNSQGNYEIHAVVMNRGRNPATNVKIKYGVFDIGKYEKTPSFDVSDIPFQGTSRLNPDQKQLLTTDSGVPKTSMDVFLARGDLIYMAGHIWFDSPLRKNIEMLFCLLRQQDHAWIYRAGLTCAAE